VRAKEKNGGGNHVSLGGPSYLPVTVEGQRRQNFRGLDEENGMCFRWDQGNGQSDSRQKSGRARRWGGGALSGNTPCQWWARLRSPGEKIPCTPQAGGKWSCCFWGERPSVRSLAQVLLSREEKSSRRLAVGWDAMIAKNRNHLRKGRKRESLLEEDETAKTC